MNGKSRLVGRNARGWNVFDYAEPEGWFDRSVRAVLTAGERPYRGPAMDIVSATTTTPFSDPEKCHDPRGHQIVPAKLDPHESVHRCSACGAIVRNVWRDQPSAWKVVAGVR